jgi:O-antigen ligase
MALGQLIQDRFSQLDRHFKSIAVLGVIGLSFYIGQSSPNQMRLYLVLFSGFLGSLVFLRKPELGLIALLVSALSVPFAIDTGTQTPVHGVILFIPLLACLWLLDRVVHKDLRLSASLMNAPLIALVIAACLSFVSGNLLWNYFAVQANMSAQLGGLAIYVLSVFAFWLMANQAKSLHWLKIVAASFLIVGTMYLLARLLPVGGNLVNAIMVPEAAGSLFWVWLVALASGLGLYHEKLRLGVRLALLGIGLLALAIGIAQAFSWASGWLPSFVALAVLLWFRFPRLRFTWSVPLGVVLLLNFQRILDAVLTTGDNLYSWETRLAAWQIVVEAVKANPVLGLGLANYYNYVRLYAIRGYYVRFNSHNNYVDLVAQLGVLGLVCFMWFVLAAWREASSLRTVKDGFARAYAYACMAGLVGSLVAGMLGDWFLPFVYNVGLAGFRASVLMWLFLGGLVVIKRQVDVADSD